MKNIKPFYKVLLINLIILFSYSILFVIGVKGSIDHEGDVYTFFGLAFVIALHFFATLLIAIILLVMKKKELGLGMLLSSLLVVIVGFSSCYGIGALIG